MDFTQYRKVCMSAVRELNSPHGEIGSELCLEEMRILGKALMIPNLTEIAIKIFTNEDIQGVEANRITGGELNGLIVTIKDLVIKFGIIKTKVPSDLPLIILSHIASTMCKIRSKTQLQFKVYELSKIFENFQNN